MKNGWSLEATYSIENCYWLLRLSIRLWPAWIHQSKILIHLYPGTIIAEFIRWTLGITISIEVNHHTTSIIHTTLRDARVHGQHTPKAPTFRLLSIQPKPNLHEIMKPKERTGSIEGTASSYPIRRVSYKTSKIRRKSAIRSRGKVLPTRRVKQRRLRSNE